jgi:hypothetical protein
MSGNPLIGAGGGLIDLGRALHGQGFVRTLVVEDVDKVVEAGLLLQEVGGGRLGGFFLQGKMRALVATVLLGMARALGTAIRVETPSSAAQRAGYPLRPFGAIC